MKNNKKVNRYKGQNMEVKCISNGNLNGEDRENGKITIIKKFIG